MLSHTCHTRRVRAPKRRFVQTEKSRIWCPRDLLGQLCCTTKSHLLPCFGGGGFRWGSQPAQVKCTVKIHRLLDDVVYITWACRKSQLTVELSLIILVLGISWLCQAVRNSRPRSILNSFPCLLLVGSDWASLYPYRSRLYLKSNKYIVGTPPSFQTGKGVRKRNKKKRSSPDFRA